MVSPCGSCRELIWDYDHDARIIVPGIAVPSIVTIGELLPKSTAASGPFEDRASSLRPAAWCPPSAARRIPRRPRCGRSGFPSSSASSRRANLRCSSRRRAPGEALDHVLFVGPPGLGKTTLAQIVARELGVNFRATSGPVIAKAGDLAALLTNLEERDVLFIDEIHRLNPAVEEILYPAMEDFQLDLIIGEGPAARSVRIDLAKFTLIGATRARGS